MSVDMDRLRRELVELALQAPQGWRAPVGSKYRDFLERRDELGPTVMVDPVSVDLLWESLWNWKAFRNSRITKEGARGGFHLFVEGLAPAVSDVWTLRWPLVAAPVGQDAFKLQVLGLHRRSLGVKEHGSQLMAASKLLHHLLPDAIVPIDRQYTAAFFGWGDLPRAPAEIDACLSLDPPIVLADGLTSSTET